MMLLCPIGSGSEKVTMGVLDALHDTQPPLGLGFARVHTTTEDLRRLRRPAPRTLRQQILRFMLFVLVGIPRTAIAGVYGFVLTVCYESLVTCWQWFQSPEILRFPLQVLWYVACRVFLFLLGVVKINYHGTRDRSAKFLVSNHLCFFDRWLFWWLWPSPVDKKEMYELPAGKAVLDVFGGLIVDRSKSSGLTEYLLQNLSADDDRLIQIFPEATTTNGEYMLKFHLGAFLSPFPVQLTAIRYHLYGTNRHISNISFFQRTFKDWISFAGIPFLTVDVTFLESKTLGPEGAAKFAEDSAFRIAEFLGLPVLDISSHAIFRPESQDNPESQRKDATLAT
jgi:1-acyl-sn-glycerol-3-phosphate acyltransferase